MNRVGRLFPAVLFALMLGGCKPAGPAPEAAAPAPTPTASASPAASADAKEEHHPQPEFPKLVVKTFDGGEFDLASQRGRWVVVNYWATWCNPCLKEIPDLAAFDKARDDVVVIGLAYEEIEKADMQAFLKEHPIPYPIAIVDVYSPPEDFETPAGLPTTYLIGPDGRVASKHLGPVTSQELDAEIAAAAKAKPAT